MQVLSSFTLPDDFPGFMKALHAQKRTRADELWCKRLQKTWNIVHGLILCHIYGDFASFLKLLSLQFNGKKGQCTTKNKNNKAVKRTNFTRI